MEATQIQKALEIHKRAYALLMWLNNESSGRISRLIGVLETPVTSASCEEWFFQNSSNIPVALWPRKQEQGAFFNMFGSFFNVSFHLEEASTKLSSLSRGARVIRGRRHKRHAQKRDEENARELERLTVRDLCRKVGIPVTDLLEQAALDSTEIASDLALFSYVKELVRRTEFASQGPSVHWLWLTLDERTRKNLTIEAVLNSEARLIDWLSKATIQHRLTQKT